MLIPELEAEVTFLPKEVSPRKGPVKPDLIGYYGCPFVFSSEAYDCRMIFPDADGPIPLGSTARVMVQFLNPHLILPRLKESDLFELWEMGTVATGRVTKIIKGEQSVAHQPA